MNKNEDINKFADNLQEQIIEQVRKEYSEAVIDHWQNPRNFKKIKDSDGYAKVTGPCGDTMEMFINIQDEKISECGFQTDGCGTTIVCGSVITEIALNKTFLQVIADVNAEDVLKHLGGLPPDNVHCAQLATETLKRALLDYRSKQKAPWKKHYRK